MTDLLNDIEKFCTDHGVAASTFGEKALNDKAFVSQLKKGRRVWPETERKVRDFMEGMA